MKFFWGFIIVFVCLGCSGTQSLTTVAPQPLAKKLEPMQPKASFFHVPISLNYKELSRQTNLLMGKEVYKDSVITDDNMTVLLEKTGAVSFSYLEGKLKTTLPVKATVKYRYGTTLLGKELYDTKTIEMQGVVNLLSSVRLNNWKLNTQTVLQNIDWQSSPTISMLGKPVKATFLVNQALKYYKKKIEDSIDEALDNNMDFKPQVISAIETLAVPTLMHPAYEAWLQVIPVELYTTNAELTKDDIKIQMGLKCLLQTTLGSMPQNTWDSSQLILKPVSKMPQLFQVNLIAFSDYKEASRLMTKNFAGYKITEGNRAIEVTKVELWQQEDKLIIALSLIGSIKGVIYLKGTPKYNSEQKILYFEDLSYVLDTKNILLKTANWLLKGTVLNKLKAKAFYSIEPNLAEGTQSIKTYLNNYEPAKGIKVNGTLNQLDFVKFYLNDQGIVVFVNASGQLTVRVDGM